MLEKTQAEENSSKSTNEKQARALTYAAFVAGLCSIVYELLIATTVSYFLGDSVRYFSLTIGMYMAAMGVGSFCSKYINDNLLTRFLQFEIALATLGGLSIPLLYLSYISSGLLIPTYVGLTCSIGFLIGLEIPFLTRLMESFKALKSNIANILTFDYIGALIATIAFPFFLLPVLGNFQSSLVLGLVNLSIIAVLMRYFGDSLGKAKTSIMVYLVMTFAVLAGGILFTSQMLYEWDQALFNDRIVHAEQSPYQKIILTKNQDDIRLFLNGTIQFSSRDEHRYHEALVSYPLIFKESTSKRVLLLGAGDGLAVKELLKYPEIDSIVLVDLDERVVELAKTNPHLSKLNGASLASPKLEIVYTDAFNFLMDNTEGFDFIVSDLPDPNTIELSRLYTKQYYQALRKNLNEGGVFVTQATSPYFATKAFWSIHNTVRASGFNFVVPYHADVPSFGDWGFVMASDRPLSTAHQKSKLETSTFLNVDMLDAMRVFSKDQRIDDVEVNNIHQPILLTYYLEGWKSFGY
ncbi:polyamine aminopropyltransferase [Glaciecola sp. MH2013]|uniref:polyamine aminopropyltransferase n=1 Tax=Glaciecola sp. MH2013 TaxID=2785524 RepID=UPI00189E5153|nr:polyamine aminopropyltransferase [Glaciecola sp. MH2013]MBF7073634.1 polyamine aminopropyltransferase [Glaciecola sp. MH2013]